MDKFNSDHSCVVMLATIGAVGEGWVTSLKSATYSQTHMTLFERFDADFLASTNTVLTSV